MVEIQEPTLLWAEAKALVIVISSCGLLLALAWAGAKRVFPKK
jgi:hypothetical protein